MLFPLLACVAPTVGPAPPDVATWTALPALSADAAWPDEAGEPIPVPEALAGVPGLDDPSAYGRDGLPDGRASAGSFGVGNGVVFGIVGLDDPVNTLTNVSGPGYDTDAGFFGDAWFALEADGVALDVTAARAQRPRGTALARTFEVMGDLSLSVTTAAPPGEAAILRVVTVQNDGPDASPTLVWRLARADDEVLATTFDQVRGARQMRLSCDEGAYDADADAWIAPLALAAGEETTLTCQQAVTSTGGFTMVDLDAPAALAATNDAVAAVLGGALVLDVPDAKVADLYEGMLVTLWTQTAPSGLVSPMSRYTRGWLRDSEGPVRLWLRAGLHDDALALLEALWLTQLAEGAVRNSFPLDTDLDAVTLPDDPATFWADADFMPGREPVEAPSYPILLHAMAADWTGTTWDAQRLAFLDACLDRQVFDGDLLPFSGDETFRFPLASAIGEGLPEDLGWSANSSFLWRAAADALGRDPGAAPVNAYWTGDYWAPIARYADASPLGEPYEDVALQPVWWPGGALDPADVAAHLDATAEALLGDDGVLISRLAGTSSPNAGYTGMVPGFWLHAAAAHHRSEEASAFAALDLVATPSGHFEELHGADHHPLAVTHDADGLGADVTARYRPWEGGDVVAAMLDYLVGFDPAGLTLAPHLPPGWPAFSVSGLRVGTDSLDVTVTGYAEGVVVRVSGAPAGLRVTLHGERAFTQVSVDGTVVDGAGDVVTVPVGAGDTEVIGAY